ncbi:unnamed protein product, partial [Symbiodinium sp. CCMP2456]
MLGVRTLAWEPAYVGTASALAVILETLVLKKLGRGGKRVSLDMAFCETCLRCRPRFTVSSQPHHASSAAKMRRVEAVRMPYFPIQIQASRSWLT